MKIQVAVLACSTQTGVSLFWNDRQSFVMWNLLVYLQYLDRVGFIQGCGASRAAIQSAGAVFIYEYRHPGKQQ